MVFNQFSCYSSFIAVVSVMYTGDPRGITMQGSPLLLSGVSGADSVLFSGISECFMVPHPEKLATSVRVFPRHTVGFGGEVQAVAFQSRAAPRPS